eukprot:CAMPEP_0174970958 /NCGR_PEP_ID=MMETSP0004_2-20121128/9711_1 /TAXON_ID=420556 /ORGANISM="Ochromonas sp., Strain CCMP1393" /LENGTH=295 /DNA_ID=CAMNT_0016220825 /DNA_START=47 /DNA_END=934 /DNA_ORIENTATION=-
MTSKGSTVDGLPEWTPPANIEELFASSAGNKWGAINAPTAGAREEKALPDGSAPVQLYSLATPNGQKVGIMLEELGIDYDAYTISIGKGEQFTSGFVAVNPNSKIPAAIDRNGPNGKPIHLFETGSIVHYFAEKHQKFYPQNPELRAEIFNWIMWQMGGQGPMTGQFGHFFVYAPLEKVETRNYGVARYGMEVQRMCDVLDKHLATRTFLVGEEYTIADIMCFPWFNHLMTGYIHSSGITAKDFLKVEKYTHAVAWWQRINERPAVVRGLQVCKGGSAHPKPWLAAAAAAPTTSA